MNTLLIILIVVAIIKCATDLFISLRNVHFQKQYDLICRQLREANESRKTECENLRNIIMDHKSYIRELEKNINTLKSGLKYKVTMEDGTVRVAEQVKDDDNEKQD